MVIISQRFPTVFQVQRGWDSLDVPFSCTFYCQCVIVRSLLLTTYSRTLHQRLMPYMSFNYIVMVNNYPNHIASWITKKALFELRYNVLSKQSPTVVPCTFPCGNRTLRPLYHFIYNISNIQHLVQSRFYTMVNPIRCLLTLTTYRSH